MRAVLGNRAALVGLVLVGAFVLLALVADLLPLRSATQMVSASRMQGPAPGAPFGFDTFGRDLLSRVLFGMRLSLQVSAAAVFLATGAGTLLGLVAGYAGGWLDRPRNDSEASVRMAQDRAMLTWTMSTDSRLGRMWRPISRGAPAPSARAASTKSRSLRARTGARTTRAKIGV